MAAATAARDAQRKEADLVTHDMGAVKIFKGTLVSIRVDGFLYPSRSGTATDTYAGVAYETVDNSAGAAGAKKCRVEKNGTYVFAKAAAVQADILQPFYAADDSTLTATATNNQLVGYGVDLISSSALRIRINGAAK